MKALLGLTLSVFLTATGLAGQGMPNPAPVPVDRSNKDCLDCHSDPDLTRTNAVGRVISLFVDEARLARSVHRTNTCVSCHVGVTLQHPDDERPVGPVDCARCHAAQSETFHASVHGRALQAGRAEAATCQDCHGGHEVVPPTDAASPLHFTRQPETCGSCHDTEAADFLAGIHGKALTRGIREAPTCTDCHSEHRIETLRGAAPQYIARDVCSRCHASERINTKFRLPSDRVETFFQSYHGLAAQYGLPVAANCGSCHGYHKVLPSTDPESSIHPANLVRTCGQCHPGATEKFALSRVHVDVRGVRGGPDVGSRINWWVRRIYLVLIACTVGAMLMHNGLLFWRKLCHRLRGHPRTVLRMDRVQRWQHGLLASSFFVLAISGFALSYPDSWLAHLLGNSEPFRRWVHRWAGVVLLLTGLWHLVYISVSAEGRRLLRDLRPRARDFRDLVGMIGYLVGRRSQRPLIGRFGYTEKFEYWAVVWGTVLMGVTGLLMWFKLEVTQWLPRWVVDVALTIHFYEAILACLAIVVWHFYHVIFDPDVYPVNPAFWDGRVSAEWYREEHPLDPMCPAPSRSSEAATAAPVGASTPPAGTPSESGPVESKRA
ncbi:cytochrome b/b6 domain-containing protein [Limisphaera sp. VF-2]|uniref:cytochrome b/b6 domain-containing protein n=1 Tax=Limisphaera sp. VF-2 TaxID=3400418 RepID=UPI0017503881|nr:cytochrome b/b6 domain-containing protein [Limisphaera sp.]